MPKVAKPLTLGQIKSLAPGMHADGNGLYLCVGGNSRSWIFRYQFAGRRRDMGLGPLRLYNLQQARDMAIDLARGLRAGIDPIESRRKGKKAAETAVRTTFGDVALAYIDAHKAEWSAGTEKAWRISFRLHVFPVIGKRPIGEIDTDDVLRVLRLLWEKNPKTAATIRGRIEQVLGLAAAKGLRKGDNPARWNGHLEFHLASPTKAAPAVQHRAALAYDKMPDFLRRLRAVANSKSDAIEFCALTATRIGETLNATWPEFDLGASVWIIPAGRTKTRREHRVPLSDAAIAVLNRQKRRNDTDYVFVGEKGKPMVAALIGQVLGRVELGITVHGFRSTFREWCAKTRQDRDLAEMALSHIVGNRVERAYNRDDLVELRRKLMREWAAHCEG